MRKLTASIVMIAGALVGASTAYGQATHMSADAETLFEKVKGNEARLRVFLQAFPKGGDLHYHLSGSIFAEDYIRWAAIRGFCHDEATRSLVPPPCSHPLDKGPVTSTADEEKNSIMLGELSHRGLSSEQIFATEFTGEGFERFDRLAKIIAEVSSESLAEARNQLADNGNSYAEIMFQPPAIDRAFREYQSGAVDPDNLQQAFSSRLPMATAAVNAAIKQLDEAEARSSALLGCGSPKAQDGCNIPVHYVAVSRRAMPANKVFTSMMLAFMLAERDSRYVGFNIVSAEDREISYNDYRLQMAMIRFLSQKFPRVHRTLHAGELSLGLVPTYRLRNDIRQAIELGGAERIGHGASVAFEKNAPELLSEMARKHVAVEINLKSNRAIGVTGSDHPIRLYLAAGVPIMLSTDDQGLNRTDATSEFTEAVMKQGLAYSDLKRSVRNSLEYSFAPGESLWNGHEYESPKSGCNITAQYPDRDKRCGQLLRGSEKARLQLALERDFMSFEKDIVRYPF